MNNSFIIEPREQCADQISASSRAKETEEQVSQLIDRKINFHSFEFYYTLLLF